MLSNPNILINSGFDVWQRGTAFNNLPDVWRKYTADMWTISTSSEDNANSASSVVKTETGVKVTAQNVIFLAFETCIENYAECKGKRVALSAYVKSFSGEPVSLSFGDHITSCYPGGVIIDRPGYYTTIIEIPDTIQSATVGIGLNPGKVFHTEFEIDYIKLEFGEVATAYVPDNYAETLARCQRHLFNASAANPQGNTALGSGYVFENGNAYITMPVSVTMRVRPTLLIDGPLYISDGVIHVVVPPENIALHDDCAANMTIMILPPEGAAFTKGNACMLWSGDSITKVLLSAEL